MRQIPSHANQKGAALIMALSVLVILTILGISAMKGSTLEYRMATSMQETEISFQTAESALAKARENIVLDPNKETKYESYKNDFSCTSCSDVNVYTNYSGESPALTERTEKPSSGDDGVYYHFQQKSVATMSSGATTTIRSGAKKLFNKN